MASSLLRGLTLLELVDQQGPMGVSDLARRLGVDKSGVSRMVAAAQKEGWVARTEDAKVVLGPRAALLGIDSDTMPIVRRAEPLVHAIAGVTGFYAQANLLVGTEATSVASAAGDGLPTLPVGLRARLPLWAGAASKVLAAQLTNPDVDALLPADPFPDARELLRGVVEAAVLGPQDPDAPPSPTTVRTRAALHRQLAKIRHDGQFHEIGELAAVSACIAVPWPQSGFVAALCCIGSIEEIEQAAPRVVRILHAATHPSATREDVVAAAARRP
jgi:IclR family acetate operon transcriptional repressor